MNIFELLFTVVIVSVCIYVIVDRICNCIENCFHSRSIVEIQRNKVDKKGEKEAKND